MFPIWSIIIIVVIVIIGIATAIFFIKRRRTRSLSVHTIHEKEDEELKEKGTSAPESLQTLVTQKQQLTVMNMEHVPSPLNPSPPSTSVTKNEQEHTTPQLNEKTDRNTTLFNESEYKYSPPESPKEIKIDLPLPPPSTSFFSDKMELDDENAQDLFDLYFKKKEESSGFVSIDMPSIYATAAANIQQKAANIKSTLRQSLRLQQKSNRNSATQIFANSKQEQQKQSEDFTTPVLLTKTPTITKKDTSRTSFVTDIAPLEKINPVENQQVSINAPQQQNVEHQVVTIENTFESPTTPNLQEPVREVNRVIRSASRKTKRYPMDEQEDLDVEQQVEIPENTKKQKFGSIRFNSIRGPKGGNSGEHMTITSGSMRRFVREGILFGGEDNTSSAPVGSLRKTSRKSGLISATEITSWWDMPKQHPDTTTDPDKVNENTLPLNINSGMDSISSSAPSQYRASLNTSLLAGTLSRGSAASLFAEKDEANNNNNNSGNLSRNSSFRKGTLGRNTLKSITNSAASGVNKSLKGLFDHSSSSSTSNKVVPDDSQKMELELEPHVHIAEEKLAMDPPKASFGSIRKKSIRTSTSLRSGLPTSYLPKSESSTKYALSDDEESTLEVDNASQKTAVDNLPPSMINSNSNPQLHKTIIIKKSSSGYSSKSRNTDQSKLMVTDDDATTKIETDFTPSSSTTNDISVNRSSKLSIQSNAPSGEVDNIRRALQDTWKNNMKESESVYSMISETDSVISNNAQPISPTTSTSFNKLTPRQQNQQSLLTKSLLSQQVAKRASLIARQNLNEDEYFIPQQGPEPSVSFSTSTVCTMVPANENIAPEPISIRQNAIINKPSISTASSSLTNGSNKIQESSFEDRSSPLVSRFSSSPMSEASSPQNSSTNSSRGHSRKSSGGNSTATALRIGSSYSSNAKTWNGRGQKKASNRPSIAQLEDSLDSPDEIYNSIGRKGGLNNHNNKRAFFSTMRKGQKTRGNIPWMAMDDQETSTEKTPAQIERDKYLGKI